MGKDLYSATKILCLPQITTSKHETGCLPEEIGHTILLIGISHGSSTKLANNIIH